MAVYALSDDLDEAVPQAAGWAEAFDADWVLIDHYRLTPGQEAQIKGARRLAVIDDSALRRWLFEASCHACDGLGADRVAQAFFD